MYYINSVLYSVRHPRINKDPQRLVFCFFTIIIKFYKVPKEFNAISEVFPSSLIFLKIEMKLPYFPILNHHQKKRVLHYQDNIGNINRKCQKLSFSQREQVLKIVLKKTHSKSKDTIIGFFFQN